MHYTHVLAVFKVFYFSLFLIISSFCNTIVCCVTEEMPDGVAMMITMLVSYAITVRRGWLLVCNGNTFLIFNIHCITGFSKLAIAKRLLMKGKRKIAKKIDSERWGHAVGRSKK